MEDHDSSQMAASAASLCTLPAEMILRIFSFLPPEDLMFGVRPTCRRFYTLSRDPDLWKQVTVTRMERVQTGRFRFNNKIFFKTLLQQECISSNGIDTLPVTTLIRSVKEIGDIWPSCSATGIMQYPELERLKLVRRIPPSVRVLVRHQRLKHLVLSTGLFLDDNNRQNSQGHLAIKLFEKLKGLTDLQTLDVHFRCSRGTNNRSSISSIQASMKDYFLTGPRLRRISLIWFVNDEILKAILNKCQQLEELIMVCRDITPEAFCAAVSGEHQLLSTLKIDEFETLNDTCLKALSDAFPNIKSLRFPLTSNITDDGFRLFLEARSQFTDLELTDIGNIMFGGIMSKNLQSLILEVITFPSASTFQKLCQYSQSLRRIELYSTNISKTDVTTLTNSCRLLEEVSIRRCSHVDSTEVLYIMKKLPHLQKFLWELSDQRVLHLEQLSPSRKRTRAGGLVLENQAGSTAGKLCSLQLALCQWTAVGVSALAKLCPNLHELKMRTPNGLNDHIVKVILRNLPNLRSLRLDSLGQSSRENQLTAACFRHVQRWGTRLEHLELITRYRSFSIAALVKFVAHSTTLKDCWVPRYTKQSAYIPDSEIFKMFNKKRLQLKHQRKRCVVTLSQALDFSMVILRLCACQPRGLLFSSANSQHQCDCMRA